MELAYTSLPIVEERFDADTRHHKKLTDLSKHEYSKATKELISYYNTKKRDYFLKVVNNTKGNTREFYQHMKNGDKTRRELPERMLANSIWVTGDQKKYKISEQLGKSFTDCAVNFSPLMKILTNN